MVAAWISAETGVGPAMASGSQTYSGICADLPQAPTSSSRRDGGQQCLSGLPGAAAKTCAEIERCRNCTTIRNIASEKPKSPMRLTMNALLPGVGGELLHEVEADQQVAAQPHAFPADEQQQVVRRQHQHQHEEHEQVQVGEEAVVAAFVRHVADGVDVDQRADAGDDQQHDRGQPVDRRNRSRR